MAQLSQLKSEKDEVLASIKAQKCQEKMQDVFGAASSMTKALQTIKNALIDVKGTVKTRINQIVGSEEVNRMDKIQVEWVF